MGNLTFPECAARRPNGHVLSLNETKRRFHGQWLAIRVTRRDEAGQPTAGRVLARSPSRLELSEAVKDVAHVCLVYAGEPIPKGYGLVTVKELKKARSRIAGTRAQP